jgi:copper chaperone CopZ
MEKKTFQVPNIGCDGCVRTIRNEVSAISGVRAVEADRETKQVTVAWESPATWKQIEDHLIDIDYAPAH